MTELKHDFENRHPLYEKNAEHRKTGKLLIDGTVSVRRERDETLPKEPREKPESYAARVNRSVLLEAYKETVDSTSLKPFSQKITFSQDLTESQEFIKTDIDGNKMTIEGLSHSMIRTRLHGGPWIGVVEMGSLDNDDGKRMNRVEVKEKGIHPYVQEIEPDSLINWVIEEGVYKLIWITWTNFEAVDGVVEEVHYIKEYTEEAITTWRKEAESEGQENWIMTQQKPNEIGIVPIVINGHINDRPILEGLAHLNLSHFRKKSDLDNILHTASVPYLHLAGFGKELKSEEEISVNNALTGPKDSKVNWVEIAGAGITAAQKDIERLEAQMSVYGFDLVTEKGASITATEKVIDNNDDMSVLQAVVEETNQTYTRIFEIMDMYQPNGLTDVLVQIFKDFNISFEVYQKVQLLITMRAAREISHETFLKEIERLKFLGDHFDPELEPGMIDDNSGVEG